MHTLIRIVAAACATVPTLAGCSSKKAVIDPSPYQGPPITIDSTGPRHTVKVEAPSGGYRVQLHRTERRFDGFDAFITITRPDPALMHTQALVTLNLDTTVPSGEPLVVFARVADFGSSGTSRAFCRAAAAR